ncbi:pantoate--beta-alanine ligase [Flavicella sp.]|uniref:pantoate--beta-alanine ligase n=1 Tax=Flavicella sp. TaxID=2957742 RepID=UPI002614558F|nr:pantoate--beta-alanine ligase [Flavicella sp.]MDG1805221.1 pantoate--beta-alanine ligase [Flavicella sp.]MDG2281363.1 pantoate--beta-alanine ligase [Flavicella sp.]
MKVVTTIKEISNIITSLKSSQKTIGLTPTMGALHEGHISLITKASSENDFSIVTIFINPTQFDKKEDLDNYPSTLDADIKLVENTGCDLIFTPNASEMYANNIDVESFSFDGLENEMEGKHRANHFDGVGTIVKKFFEITQPTKAYFGEKDFQQLQIIKKMTVKNQLPIEIIGCPIFREKDGLAMSSRNTRLSKKQRESAPFIFKTLTKASQLFQSDSIATINSWIQTEFDSNPDLDLEYFEIANEQTLQTASSKSESTKYRAFIAVYAGKIRLIDNISLQ